MCLNEAQHDHFIRSSINSQDRIGKTIEFLNSFNHRTVELFATFEHDAEIDPFLSPFHFSPIQDDIVINLYPLICAYCPLFIKRLDHLSL